MGPRKGLEEFTKATIINMAKEPLTVSVRQNLSALKGK